MLLIDEDHITGSQLATAARFQFAVDHHIAVLNRQLGLATAADDADELEKLIERQRTGRGRCHGLILDNGSE